MGEKTIKHKGVKCSNCGGIVQRLCSSCWRCKKCCDCANGFKGTIDGKISKN